MAAHLHSAPALAEKAQALAVLVIPVPFSLLQKAPAETATTAGWCFHLSPDRRSDFPEAAAKAH
jgi:hypothetical protein